MLSSNQGEANSLADPDFNFPGRETSIEVKLDSRVSHVVSAGNHGTVLRDRADGRTIQTSLNKKSWTRGFSRVPVFSRVQAKDVVRGSRRRKAIKTSLVRRVEIGT